MIFLTIFITNQILLEVAKFLNRGVFVDVKVVETDCAVHSLSHPTIR